MADGGTNLPGDQRALLGRIVADEQDRVRLVQLRHCGAGTAACVPSAAIRLA